MELHTAPGYTKSKWPYDWFDFLEVCRLEAETQGLQDKPWVCQCCGKEVGRGAPSSAASRTGNSLWMHLLSNVGVNNHPEQDDIDRWEEQTPHKQTWSSTTKKPKKRSSPWGTVEDLRPYLDKLDIGSLHEVRRVIDAKLSDSGDAKLSDSGVWSE